MYWQEILLERNSINAILKKSIHSQKQKIKEFELIMDNCINNKYILKEQEIDKICDEAIYALKMNLVC